MIVDFNDYLSIREWIAVWPERHTNQLRALWKAWPWARAAIERAVLAP